MNDAEDEATDANNADGETWEDFIVCEWPHAEKSYWTRGVRAFIDRKAGTVTFEHCHRPRRFWAIHSDASYTCHLDDLLAIHLDWIPLKRYSRHGLDATISTPDGQVVLNSKMHRFDEFVAIVQQNIGLNRGPLVDNQNLWYVGVVLLAVLLSGLGLLWATAD